MVDAGHDKLFIISAVVLKLLEYMNAPFEPSRTCRSRAAISQQGRQADREQQARHPGLAPRDSSIAVRGEPAFCCTRTTRRRACAPRRAASRRTARWAWCCRGPDIHDGVRGLVQDQHAVRRQPERHPPVLGGGARVKVKAIVNAKRATACRCAGSSPAGL